MLEGHATPEGTARLAARATGLAPDFYGLERGLTLSSLGLGTYLGPTDAGADAEYEEALAAALAAGIDHVDTAINYREQASERAVGRALAAAVAAGVVARDEVLVATKGGFVPDDRDAPGRGAGLLAGVPRDEVIDDGHCLHPRFVERALARSLENLRLRTVDVYYLHNPETQLPHVAKAVLYERLRRAFEVLEKARARGELRWFGVATWGGLRKPPEDPAALQLERLVAAARSVAGPEHGLAFVQLPVGLASPEAVVAPTQQVDGARLPALEAARRLGLVPVGSGPLLQGRLLVRGLPASAAALGHADLTPAARALLFARSSGVATALVGMRQAAHVRQNLAAGRAPRLAPERVREAAGQGG